MPRNDSLLSLTSWITSPSPSKGVSFISYDGNVRRFSYDELSEQVMGAATFLANKHIGPGSRLVLLLHTGPAYVISVYASLTLDATCVPACPPLFNESRSEFVDRITRILNSVAFDALIVDDKYTELVSSLAPEGSCIFSESTILNAPMASPIERSAKTNDHPAIIQYSSGSTSSPRGVVLFRDQIEADISSASEWLHASSDDVMASWLPLHHDMGLIGTLLAPVAMQIDILLIAPETFIRRPQLWFDCFTTKGATLSAAPPFALDYCVRRLNPDAGVDLSGWRALIVGSEPIPPELLRTFAHAYSGVGFSPRTFCPGYGLAEATVAVTGVPPEEEPQIIKLREETDPSRPLVPENLMAAVPDSSAPEFTMLGRPIDRVQVSIRTENGEELAPEKIGEVWVGGPTVAEGYYNDPDETKARFRRGWVRTGDVGMLVHEQLIFLGRDSDRITVRGRNFYVEDLEYSLSTTAAVRRGSVIVVPRTVGNDVGLAVLWETRLADERAADTAREMIIRLAQRCGGNVPIHVVALKRGTLPRTINGKLRRRAAAFLLQQGTIGQQVIASSVEV